MLPVDHHDVLRIARALCAEFPCPNDQTDLVALGKHLGVARVEGVHMESDGCLLKKNGTYAIYYRLDRGRSRQRFTIAHEIAHILIERCGGGEIPERGVRRAGVHSGVERLAERVAAELLMPQDRLIHRLRALCALELSAGRRIARRRILDCLGTAFDVSESALVFRLLELDELVSVLVRIDAAPKSDDRAPLLHVDFTSGVSACTSAEYLAVRLLHERLQTVHHLVDVHLDGGARTVCCEGWLRRLNSGNTVRSEYWVVGWSWRHEFGMAHDDSVNP